MPAVTGLEMRSVASARWATCSCNGLPIYCQQGAAKADAGNGVSTNWEVVKP